MGNCGTKPKVLKDSDDDPVPVEQESTAPADRKKIPAEDSQNNAPNAEEEATVAAKRSVKGKEIMIEDDDVEEEHIKRSSLSPLFHENKTLEIGAEPESNYKTDASSEVLKLDASPLMASNLKPPETFDVQTRNDLEVDIPKESMVNKTPEANEADEQKVDFSENWEVKFPDESEAKDLKKTSSDEKPKLPVASEVSAPELSDVKVTKTKELDVPEVLEDKNIREVSEVKTDEAKLAESKLLKASEIPEGLEIKVPKVSEVKTDEAKLVESELVKSSEVSEALEIKVPKVSEVKTNESEVKKTDEEELKVKIPEEAEVPVFVDAPEKIDKLDQPQIHDVSAPELSKVDITKESYVPEVLENKNLPGASKVKTGDEVKVAESELPNVSEVKSPEDLDMKVPKVSEVKTDQGASKVKIPEETEVAEFVDAQDKIDKQDQDQIHEDIEVTKYKEIVLPKTEREEDKEVSLAKQVKESTLSDLGNK